MNLADKRHVLSCMCGHDLDHSVVFEYWRAEGSFPSTLTVYTGLNHYLPVWKRLAVAIKYVLGIDNTYCTYTETMIDGEAAANLHHWLTEVIEDQISKETGIE